MSVDSVAIGELKHRLVLERNVRTADDAGGYQDLWLEVCKLWGRLTPVDEVEQQLLAHYKRNTISHLVILRYTPLVKISDRLVYQKRIFYPQSLINLQEDKRFLRLLVKEYREEEPLPTPMAKK